MTRSKKSEKSSKKMGGRPTAPSPVKPPPFKASLSSSKTIRFANSSGMDNASVITNLSLLDLVCQATSSTVLYRTFTGVKLNWIKMWGTPTNSYSPVLVQCQYDTGVNSTFGAPTVVISDTSAGITPAYIKTRPPKESLAAKWFNVGNTSAPLFTLQYPTYCDIDVNVSFVNDFSGASSVTSVGTSGAGVGVNYIRALDSASSTNILAPVGVATI